ncbi:GlsB/YeaQ/YmgE family stress response membrane protein [Allokutzneria sp. NRRL B-24872]|uniref:GlsB/YeaQ/YmgE family stress response membrane protein n=1 Tax=Allokutzneria sp. NRRL B-24872 TaxID=1137961 RepID=UPI000A39A231|nr:GlsB/YeaQ/YmgE family stress response membrane protein [Allokutzneria sp. NRRL B-24872]
MSVSVVISAVVMGVVIGVMARIVLPGKQRIPLWLTALVGIGSALVGTLLAGLFNLSETPGIDWIELLIQLGIASLGVAIAEAVLAPAKRKRRRRTKAKARR